MKKIALITGGNSGEYEISLKTAENIMNKIDRRFYEPYLIHLKGNEWTYTAEDGRVVEVDRNDFSLLVDGKKITFEAVFIAIHGNPGENGRLQAYFDMIGMRYTGCGMLASALTFNKFYCNLAVSSFGVPISKSLHYFKGDKIDAELVEREIQYPCFVKSCNSGSSVGVTKVHNASELVSAVEEAFKYDSQLIIEKYLKGKEVTCGVARINGKIQALAVTQIVTTREYYDYKSKYTDGLHDLITPAQISDDVRDKIFRYSEKLYRELACGGIVRMDYIVTADGTPYFLEVNTIPGQTAMSIVPCQIKYLGMDLTEVYSSLIEEALQNDIF